MQRDILLRDPVLVFLKFIRYCIACWLCMFLDVILSFHCPACVFRKTEVYRSLASNHLRLSDTWPGSVCSIIHKLVRLPSPYYRLEGEIIEQRVHRRICCRSDPRYLEKNSKLPTSLLYQDGVLHWSEVVFNSPCSDVVSAIKETSFVANSRSIENEFRSKISKESYHDHFNSQKPTIQLQYDWK